MKIETINKNPMASIVAKVVRVHNNKIYRYAKVYENGRHRTIYVGRDELAPTSNNTKQWIAYYIV